MREEDNLRHLFLPIFEVEDRIGTWLECHGVIPETPGMKRHTYFDEIRSKISLNSSSIDNREGKMSVSSQNRDDQTTMRNLRINSEVYQLEKLNLPGVKYTVGHRSSDGLNRSDIGRPADQPGLSLFCKFQEDSLNLQESSLLSRRKMNLQLTLSTPSKAFETENTIGDIVGGIKSQSRSEINKALQKQKPTLKIEDSSITHKDGIYKSSW